MTDLKFSANLGMLWADRPLPQAIRAARNAGFDAVEFHWPYDVPAARIASALKHSGLAALGINTRRGDVEAGERGLAALPGRSRAARALIDEAIEYAATIKARNVHVMAGNESGAAAHRHFVDNLVYACAEAAAQGIGIVIEPLNPYDAPGYFLRSTGQARAIIDEVGAPNLRLMFDCYHVQLIEGNLTHRLKDLLPVIGHIQFAAVPDRGPPDHGEVDFRHVFDVIRDLGYEAPVGAEYLPGDDTDATLGWLKALRGQAARAEAVDQ
jgi:hydroxypyruvate isomerase